MSAIAINENIDEKEIQDVTDCINGNGSGAAKNKYASPYSGAEFGVGQIVYMAGPGMVKPYKIIEVRKTKYVLNSHDGNSHRPFRIDFASQFGIRRLYDNRDSAETVSIALLRWAEKHLKSIGK